MRFGSLFSGIGGFDLGLERADMECAWQVEIDPYCQKVLAKHWPTVTRYGDIKTIDWTEVEPVDLICGGFPCQPVSLAGRRLAQADERWLWPEFERCLRHVRPRYALVENVPGLLSAGMGDVLGDLAALGYDAEWDCIPASAVGAPHRRYRVWLVAYAGAAGRDGTRSGDAGCADSDAPHRHVFGDCGAHVADPESDGRKPRGTGDAAQEPAGREPHRISIGRLFSDADRESLGRLAESRGERGQWTTEPDVGRVADGVPARVDRLRGLGNAVVPQVVEWIGRRIVVMAS